jgi:hypothetical protein
MDGAEAWAIPRLRSEILANRPASTGLTTVLDIDMFFSLLECGATPFQNDCLCHRDLLVGRVDPRETHLTRRLTTIKRGWRNP